MNTLDTEKRTLGPTPGMLALAEELVEGQERKTAAIATVPASAYTDPEYFAHEKAAIFERMPQILCPSALLPDPGMAVPHDATGRPLLITRDAGAKAHVFLNVCRHRGHDWSRAPRRCARRSSSALITPGRMQWTGGCSPCPAPILFPASTKARWG